MSFSRSSLCPSQMLGENIKKNIKSRNNTCLQVMWKMWKCAVKCGNAVSNYGKPKWKRKYELTLKSLKTNTFI